MIKSKIYKEQKIIKVIDTPLSSFLLEKILEGETNFNEIIEIKKDQKENKIKAKNILKISKKKIFLKNKFITTNSLSFFWTRSKILNFLKFYKLRKDIFAKIDFKKNHIYIGCKTSTIMNVIPKSNRIFIDHGFDDYKPKAYKLSKLNKIEDILKEKITKYIGYPYISLNEKMKSYTVCKIPKFSKNFIDMQNLPTNQILKSYFIRIKKKYPKINTIFLLDKNWHTNHHYKKNKKLDYDQINFELIKKYIPKGQKFFIKFHDFAIQSNQVSKFFIKQMNNLGYHAVDVDRYFKIPYRGMIPAELLIGKLKLTRVISRYTSALHNISHNTSINCIMDMNPELHYVNYNSKYYNVLLKEFNNRYTFNKSIRGKVNIKSIHEQNI